MCKEKKDASEFTKRPRRCDKCIDEHLAKSTPEHKMATREAWLKNNPDKVAAIKKRNYLKRLEKEPDYQKKLYKRQLEINPDTFKNRKRPK